MHVDGKVDPGSDISTIHTELILADLQTLEKAIPRLEKEVKGRKADAALLESARAAQTVLDAGRDPLLRRQGHRPRAPARAAAAHHQAVHLRLQRRHRPPVGRVAEGHAARPGRPRRRDLPRRQDRVRARRAGPRGGRGAARVASARTSRGWTSWPASASRPSACRPTSPPAPRSRAPGRSARAGPRPRPRVSSTPTSSAASSRPRWSRSATWTMRARWPRRSPADTCASRARTT